MPKGKHPQHALNSARIRSLSKPGRYTDGNGLYLVVDPTGAKRWLLRTMIHGKRRDIGLGGLRTVSLADARTTAQKMRASARGGGDPLAERKKALAVMLSFREAAGNVHAAYSSSWRNPKHAAQWMKTLEQYVYPDLGDRPVSQISTADILKVLAPIWLTKAETARRVRQRIAAVMDWAKASGLLIGENPVDGVAKGLPKQRATRAHHAALPYAEVSDFVRRLQESDAGESVRLAFEFLILTAARTGEIVGAKWGELDVAGRVWTVPADRMKAQREHRVPLSDRAVAILERARVLAGDSEFIFPGRSPQKPISNMAFLMTLRRMGDTVTAHGFRSAFRDWASEQTNYPREVCEMALAHSIRDKTEAAYRRGDLFNKRQQLMHSWGRYVCPTRGKVIRLGA